MKSFKTIKSHLVMLTMLFILLVYYTFLPENTSQAVTFPILIIIDAIVLSFVLSSYMGGATLNGSMLSVKKIIRTKSIDLNTLDYVYVLAAFGRWVIILSDGKTIVVVSSQWEGFSELVEDIKPYASDVDKEKMSILSEKSINRKKYSYNAALIALCVIVLYGIVR